MGDSYLTQFFVKKYSFTFQKKLRTIDFKAIYRKLVVYALNLGFGERNFAFGAKYSGLGARNLVFEVRNLGLG